MVILTGGAGFIGSCFLWKLNKEGITEVIVVDDLDKSSKWENLVGKQFQDYIHKDDFLDLLKSDKVPMPSHIVHLGACSSTTEEDADYLMENNYKYSKELAKWAVQNEIPFMYASSGATYGDGNAGYSDGKENTLKLRPLNMYGFSKHLFDLWILNNKLEDKVTGFKFFNVFGPNEYHKGEMRSVICKKYPELEKEGVIRLFKSYRNEYEDGEQKRDFVYIKDAVKVMYYFFRNPDKSGIINVGTGKARTWNDLAACMFKALDKKPNIKYIEMSSNLRGKYQYFTEANIDKLRNKGCSHKFMSLEESVEDYMEYLKENKYL